MLLLYFRKSIPGANTNECRYCEMCSTYIQIFIALTLTYAREYVERHTRYGNDNDNDDNYVKVWKNPNDSRDMCFGRPLLTFIA